MEVVYYYDPVMGISPVKKYLQQYHSNEGDSQNVRNRKLKLISQLASKISFIQENNGRPMPPTSTPLRDYNFFEIKHRKDQNILIRVTYFCHQNRLVLLYAFEKPDNYDSTREKRIIIKQYDIADKYRINFIANPNNYEKY